MDHEVTALGLAAVPYPHIGYQPVIYLDRRLHASARNSKRPDREPRPNRLKPEGHLHDEQPGYGDPSAPAEPCAGRSSCVNGGGNRQADRVGESGDEQDDHACERGRQTAEQSQPPKDGAGKPQGQSLEESPCVEMTGARCDQ